MLPMHETIKIWHVDNFIAWDSNETIQHDRAQRDDEQRATETERDASLLRHAASIGDAVQRALRADIGDMFALAAQEAHKRKITPEDLRRIAFLLSDKADEAAAELGCEAITNPSACALGHSEARRAAAVQAIPAPTINPFLVGPNARHWLAVNAAVPVYRTLHGVIRHPRNRPEIGDTLIGHLETVDVQSGTIHVRMLSAG